MNELELKYYTSRVNDICDVLRQDFEEGMDKENLPRNWATEAAAELVITNVRSLLLDLNIRSSAESRDLITQAIRVTLNRRFLLRELDSYLGEGTTEKVINHVLKGLHTSDSEVILKITPDI